ncbi:MAG: two component transcriptional regulator, partial [Parcubacteria group bacterium Gr01-1014_66]
MDIRTDPGASHPHILLVEDEEFILDLLTMKFQQGHYRLSIAKDAETAVSILEKEKIDLILLDIRLPGKDGFTFLSELKNDPVRKAIPVIILSNLGQREEREKGLKLGA